jgi:hypothetical protein
MADETYLVQGAAAAISITLQIISDGFEEGGDRGATRQRHTLADHADPRAGDRAPSQGDAPIDPGERHHESVELPM